MKSKQLAGLVILGIVVMGGAYFWITDIAPDIERVSKIQQETRQENERIYQERAASFQLDEQFPDCYYDEERKVRFCN